jgi:RNA-directed DNA polymerase
LVRSADDFIVTEASRELLENEVRSVIESFLHERGLVHSAEQSKITHVRASFDFLAQTLRKFSPNAEVQREASFTLNFGVRV